MSFKKDDRVQWLHLPNFYRHGTVVDIDGSIGVRATDGDGVVYVKAEYLEKEPV
jgi:hypothetical protein